MTQNSYVKNYFKIDLNVKNNSLNSNLNNEKKLAFCMKQFHINKIYKNESILIKKIFEKEICIFLELIEN